MQSPDHPMPATDGAGDDATTASVRCAPDDLHKAIDEHAAAAYRIALAIVRDQSLADDVVQETMIKAWRSSPVGPGAPVPRSWLLKVARNTAISVLRTRREELHGPTSLPETDSGPGPGRTVMGRAALDELWRVLAHLDEESRTLVVMRELDGMSYEEISEALELPLPTVKTRLFRARRALKDAMEAWR